MKKLLLTLAAAGAIVTASAAVDFTQNWSISQKTAEEAVFSAPVAFDSKGNIVTVSPVNGQTVDLGANLLILSKENGSEILKCAIEGSVTVSAIAIDEADNIFIAGTLADEVVFNGKDNTSTTIKGMEIDGAATVEQNASFIAKYTADGKIVKAISLAPSVRGEYAGTMDEAPAPGSLFFSINHLMVSGSNVYVSALYTGTTTPADGIFKTDITFDSNYWSGWYGLFIGELKAATIFSLDSDLSNGIVLADVKAPGNPEMDMDNPDIYQALSVSFNVKDETVYAGFVGFGDLTISAAGKDTKFNDDAANRDMTFKYATFDAAGLKDVLGSAVYLDVNKDKSNLLNSVLVDNAGNIFGLGNIHTETADPTNSDNSTYNSYLIVNKIAKDATEVEKIQAELAITADVASEEISSAAILPSGEIAVSALNFFTMAAATEKKGEFAGTASAYIFNGKDFDKANQFENPIAFAAKGENLATSSIVEGGTAFSLYTAKASGITDIVADENVEAEYFDLQGVKVANPENGLYIVRRGNKVTKEIIR